MSSPELALVDAELSAALRARLPDISEDVAAAPSARTDARMAEQHDDLEVAARYPSAVDDAPEPAAPEPEPVVDDLPDYVIAPAVEVALDVDDASSSPAHAPATGGEPPEDVIRERVEEYSLAAEAASMPVTTGFPTLPSLEVRQEALDETDAALRKIRDQLGGSTGRRKPRVRRRFIVLSGLSAVAGLAALVADSYSHGAVAQASGWLGL